MMFIIVFASFVATAFALAHFLDSIFDPLEEEEEEPITLRSADSVTVSFEDERPPK